MTSTETLPKREPAVLNVAGVAAILNVAPWSVRELIRTGKLPSFRVGRLVRVSRAAVERFIEAEQGDEK